MEVRGTRRRKKKEEESREELRGVRTKKNPRIKQRRQRGRTEEDKGWR